MVKFARQLEAQLVPEWGAAYVNYKLLKKEVKRAKEQPRGYCYVDVKPEIYFSGPVDDPVLAADALPMSSAADPPHPAVPSLVRSMSRVHESFRTLVHTTGTAAAHALRSKSAKRKCPRDPIQVRRLDGEHYETVLQETFGNMESAKIFFARLDSELNKVNHFYMEKEREFVEHAQTLEKQMQGLLDTRRVLEDNISSSSSNNPSLPRQDSSSRSVDEKDASSNPLFRLLSLPAPIVLDEDLEAGDTTQAACPEKEPHNQDSNVRSKKSAIAPVPSAEAESLDDAAAIGSRTPDRQMMMKIKIPLTTPSDALSALTQTLREKQQAGKDSPDKDLVESQNLLDKKKINAAEKMLRNAFVEYYRGLNMLKNYSSLNLTAFAKILKKYDKVTGQRTLPIYIKAVETSYFNTSDKILKLIEKVETLFANFFTGHNRRKAMMSLRPRRRKSSHAVTFFLGLFSGGSLALLAVFAILLDLMLPDYNTPSDEERDPEESVPHGIYLKTIFPVFSVAALILIHMYMYGANLYFWSRMRINYAFVFEFKQLTELHHREVLMTASILTTVLLSAMVGHLALHSMSDSPSVDLIPLGVIALLVALLFFPLNIFYRSSRVFLLTCLLHCLWAPLYKVVLADFFLADQMTSQVPMLRNLQYVTCYYFGSFFTEGDADSCLDNDQYKGLTYLMSLLPYWWRFMQCVRRFVDEADQNHLKNAAKYFSAMLAVALRIQHGRDGSAVWSVLFISVSTAATAYQIYWDLVIDWGLLRRDSSNKWLRDNLIMPKKKYIYFISMILNVILRLAWLQSIVRFRFGQMDFQVADFTFAALEVIRRGMWNFFRIENEHLNNVGKYRATKTVPLPFEDPARDD
ncbi:xenotropic and polytropic retrovirus receptor 1 [Marchantia polymorpha subsp. ruderalis]|uniref:Uncharacterized protein n=2 Tax=Marchantia polymorpha TaxID=3197 RepID=A0AAF6C1A5_MARPO|nr:hypothetical protein MARPO_0067s0074 [Marchantia polymorpha]BBN18039.1 hypothetical protein Mp_7g19040 [Marchantia polymorpha subsp. ruderalis]|eukprot:PTQ35997.1 hypothetical protein MARPO_0067s0074 [Marchantia polymorpha]